MRGKGFAECEGYSVSKLEAAGSEGSLSRFPVEPKMSYPIAERFLQMWSQQTSRKGGAIVCWLFFFFFWYSLAFQIQLTIICLEFRGLLFQPGCSVQQFCPSSEGSSFQCCSTQAWRGSPSGMQSCLQINSCSPLTLCRKSLVKVKQEDAFLSTRCLKLGV